MGLVINRCQLFLENDGEIKEKSKASSSFNLMRKYCLNDGCYNRGPRRSLGDSDRIFHRGNWELNP